MLRSAAKLSLCLLIACGSDSRPAAGSGDAGGDEAPLDAGAPDSGVQDVDSGHAQDAGLDAPECEEFELPADCTSELGPLPDELRCTGLYGNWSERALACGVREYKPAYELWSDGAAKRRFVQLPPGSTIDVSDPDAFVFPVGTQFWKEFSVQREGELRRAETRLLRKVEAGWLYTTYVWDAGGAAARQVNSGVADWSGTGHSVPTRDQCDECHDGREDRVLGWDFVMLGAGATGVTRELLAAEGRLTPAAAPGLSLAVPGNDLERAALGYLHANCGVSCHADTPLAKARETGFLLRLDADNLGSVLDTDAVRTGVDVPPGEGAKIEALVPPEGGFFRIRPGDPAATLALVRMGVRGSEAQMPPLASAKIDPHGLEVVGAWVEGMAEAGGN